MSLTPTPKWLRGLATRHIEQRRRENGLCVDQSRKADNTPMALYESWGFTVINRKRRRLVRLPGAPVVRSLP